MGKPQIQDLVAILGAGVVDEVGFERNFQAALRALALGPARTRAEVLGVEVGEPLVRLPDHLTAPPWDVYYDAQRLTLTTHQELRSAYGAGWRDMTGSPTAYTLEEVDEGWIRLHPTPSQATIYPIVPLWSPLGADLALNGLVVIATDLGGLPERLLEWLDLWVAMEVLGRSLAEDSPTQDVEVAQMCASLAGELRGLLGA